MKTILTLLFASLALPTIFFAQGTPRPRRVTIPPQPQQIQVPAPQPPAEAVPAVPAENITLSLSGALGEGLPVDISLTGCGQVFSCNITMGSVKIGENEVPIVGSLNFTVTEQDGDRLVLYSVGYRIPSPTSVNHGPQGMNTSISFQDMMVTGEARCVLDKGVEIFKTGEKSLTLKVTKP